MVGCCWVLRTPDRCQGIRESSGQQAQRLMHRSMQGVMWCLWILRGQAGCVGSWSKKRSAKLDRWNRRHRWADTYNCGKNGSAPLWQGVGSKASKLWKGIVWTHDVRGCVECIPRILYISCNPLALAADLEYLREGVSLKFASAIFADCETYRNLGLEGYVVVSLAIFDMFPYTSHVETWIADSDVRLYRLTGQHGSPIYHILRDMSSKIQIYSIVNIILQNWSKLYCWLYNTILY